MVKIEICDKIVELINQRKKIAIVGYVGSGKSYLIDKVLNLLEDKEILHLEHLSYADYGDFKIDKVFENEFVDMFHDLIVFDIGEVPQTAFMHTYCLKEKVCSIIFTMIGTINEVYKYKTSFESFDVIIVSEKQTYTLLNRETYLPFDSPLI